MYTEEEINLITLSYFCLPYKTNIQLLENFGTTKPDFAKHKNSLIKTLPDGVYNKVEEKFSDREYRKAILDGLNKKGIVCVTYLSPDYPETLKNTSEPPVVLYCKGDAGLLNSDCFSIVGSRKTMPKEADLCKRIAGEISQKFTVVSGIAEGADSKAVEGALEADGKVICVLANGLDRVYPACNAKLQRKVGEKGLLITEYPPDEKPQRHYFPFRNRIIAGLSRGTLVISAGKKSGALITAKYAFEYDRSVFALPYSVGMTSGEGCNALLKIGACLTRNALDIFNDFGLDFKRREKISLGGDERAVYEIIKNSGSAFLPAIADKLKKPVQEITAVVMSLTVKGLIIGEGGNRYSALQ